MTTLSAREFNQDVSAAKRKAVEGPVIITDRGQPAFVLMAIDEFRRLSGAPSDLVCWLAMENDEFVFEPEPVDLGLRVADL